MRLKRKTRDTIFSVAGLVPAAIIVGACMLVPVIQTVGYSFLDYKLARRVAGGRHFVGFANYLTVLQTGELANSLIVTIAFVAWVTLILFLLGMAMALMLGSVHRGGRILRGLALLPWVTPTIISALLWSWIFQPQYGALNFILKGLGLIKENASWLADPNLALPSIMIAAIWKQLPFMFLMLLAGLQGIPRELHEAALIDGAGPAQSFFAVTLPSLRNVIRTTILMTVIANFKQFPLFQIMTNGGPMDRTTNLAILSYRYAFGNLDFGTGAAVSTVWLAILVIFSILYARIFPEGERE